jgi:hypothetical protein
MENPYEFVPEPEPLWEALVRQSQRKDLSRDDLIALNTELKAKLREREAQLEAFVGVARTITKTEPPEWLPLGLEHFSEDVLGAGAGGPDVRQEVQSIVKEAHDAVGVLLKHLPLLYRHLMGSALPCPPQVETVLEALPWIKADLEPLIKQRTGRRPDARRQLCAAVVLEAWKLVHNKAEPRSETLYQACKEYWSACGGEEVGETDDLLNWRRPVEQALAAGAGTEWIRWLLLAAQKAEGAVQNTP